MPEALESISSRPVGTVTPPAPPAGAEDATRSGRSAFGLTGLAEYGGAPSGARDGTRAGAEGQPDRLNLSPEARQQLDELKRRDAEVRAHENAHLAAGGAHVVGGANYTWQKGPDGRQYAIGGHVSIDASSVPGDPDASKEKAQQVRRAALAPGEPSGQDRQVASRAAAQEARAAREQRNEEEESQGVSALGAAPQAADAGLSASREADPVDPARRRAVEAYADMSLRGVMPTALAPGGTGISFQV